jgi:predicted RecA/RadA family phage recombinase
MTKTYVSEGTIIEATAPSGGIVAGVGLLVGARLFGVAMHAAAVSTVVQLKTTGLHTMAKTSALAITRGDVLYWDATNKVVNKTTASQVAIGVANADAANPSATVEVLLWGVTQPGT